MPLVVVRHPLFAAYLLFTTSFWIFNCPDNPAAPSGAPPFAQTIHFTPDTVGVGESSTATVTLSGPAPDGGLTLTLTGPPASVLTIPSSVFVPAGGTTASFVATLRQAPSNGTEVLVQVFTPGREEHLRGELRVRVPGPPAPVPLRLVSLVFDSDDVVGGDDIHGTIGLSRTVQADDPRGVEIDGDSGVRDSLFTLAAGVKSLRFKVATNVLRNNSRETVVARFFQRGDHDVRADLLVRSRVRLTSITPSSGARGAMVDVTFDGENLAVSGGTRIRISQPSGITISDTTVVSNERVTARFTIAEDAQTVPWNVEVETNNGVSNTLAFTITVPPVPTIASISPASGSVGFSVPVTIIGSNFTGGASVAISGGDVTISGVTVVNSTTVTATFQLGQFAAGGARNVTVTTSDGTSNAVTFTIVP